MSTEASRRQLRSQHAAVYDASQAADPHNCRPIVLQRGTIRASRCARQAFTGCSTRTQLTHDFVRVSGSPGRQISLVCQHRGHGNAMRGEGPLAGRTMAPQEDRYAS